MDIKELDYILAISREGSISKAAQSLFMSQSSLSQFLSKIENELNTVLFVRGANGVRPTYAGEIFIENAKEMNLILKRVKNQILDIEYLRAGKVELGISTYRGMYLLPKVLKEFNSLYPQIEVKIYEADSHELKIKIAKGELDLALIAASENDNSIFVENIMRDEVLIICSNEDDILPKVEVIDERMVIQPEYLHTSPFLLSGPSKVLGIVARDLFKQSNLSPPILNDNLTAFFASSLARQGLGLAFTYNSCKVNENNECYLRIGNEGIFVDLSLIYPPDKYKSYATKILAKLLADLF